MATGLSLYIASRRAAVTSARLQSAERALEALTDDPSDTLGRAAVAWGYAARMRLGMESPFRLIEVASRDPRLTRDEQRTVSWALLATLSRGESHQFDAAALDRLVRGADVRGERHAEIIDRHMASADDPRATELAMRLAYMLAAAERLVHPSAPHVVAQAAALAADRETARRESAELLRDGKGSNTIAAIADARRRHALYVERPVLMAPPRQLEDHAIALVPRILADVRALAAGGDEHAAAFEPASGLPSALMAAAATAEPAAELTVSVRRHLPALRATLPAASVERIARAHNAEMLVAAMAGSWSREERRQLGRLHLAAATGMRARAQHPVWFAGDAVPTPGQLGVAVVSFDADVPRGWRHSQVVALGAALSDLRRVFPALDVTDVSVRFRMKSPADSALAMHEPKTRTLHLPVGTMAGTLAHEIAHDLDRQVALKLGRRGYWSDVASRPGETRARGAASRVAASLRALTEEAAGARRDGDSTERPAEIFATRVDWFVAQALARQGRSSGFLSAAQDEMLTGHVLHPERLRGAGRSRSLLMALEGMTTVAPFARFETEPSVYATIQLVLRSPLDARGSRALAGVASPQLAASMCAEQPGGHAGLVLLAAESRARGVLRAQAEATPPDRRPNWARAALGEAPWLSDALEERVHTVATRLLAQLADPGLTHGVVASRVDALIARARCGS